MKIKLAPNLKIILGKMPVETPKKLKIELKTEKLQKPITGKYL